MKRKSIIQGFPTCAAFLIFVVLASGCVGPTVRTYSGDKLQKPELAVIKGWYAITPLAYESIVIYSIDGSKPNATKVEVLPGFHELQIINYTFSFFALAPSPPSPWARVAFNFEAGHEYKIKKLFSGIVVKGVKIIDVTTGAIILTQPWIRDEIPYARAYFSACVQPLPENHGSWSKEEVDTVIDAIVTAANQHGLKKKWELDQGYTLSGKGFVLSLNAHFLYDKNGSRHKSPSLMESSSPFRHLSLRKLNIQKAKGTIWLDIELISFQITDSERLLVEKIWHEVLDKLRNKFGERMEEGGHIKIYKLEP